MRSMTRHTRCDAPTASPETVRQRLQARRWSVMVQYPFWDDDWARKLSPPDAQVLLQIFEATRRLERGTYGSCVRCCAAIETHRLAEAPEAPICQVCEMFTGLDATSGTTAPAP
jgi:hypothetical protein